MEVEHMALDIKKRRERVVRRVLSLRTPDGAGVGIWGAEVCQVCGELGTYHGWAGATASHRGGVFVAPRHAHGLISSAERRVLIDRGWRFCGICATRVTRVHALRSPVCAACAETAELPQAPLRELERRRYLDLVHPTLDGLLKFADGMESQREIAAARWRLHHPRAGLRRRWRRMARGVLG